MTREKIECPTHGTCDETFLCEHLTKGSKLGFNCGFSDEEPDTIHPDAWCDKCDEILDKEGSWTDKAMKFANIKLLCSSCYETIRKKNWIDNTEKFEEIINESYKVIEKSQQDIIEKFNLGKHERWDWYQDTGLLIWSHEGKEVVKAKIDFAGTLCTNSNTWLWAWGNSSLLENIKSESRKVRDIGEEYNILKLACGKWDADEIDGWEMTTIMAKQLDAIAVHRAPSEYNSYVYMVIREISWA